jgi:hypothetical protein
VANKPKIVVKQEQLLTMKTAVKPYGARHWSVYYNGKLLAVTVYKKGALAVRDALQSKCRSSIR